MSKVTVVAKVVSIPEFTEKVKAELLKLVEPTRKEKGCIEYRLHQDNDDPAVLIFYENWESRACLDQHIQTEHYRNYVSAVENLIAEKVVHKLTETA